MYERRIAARWLFPVSSAPVRDGVLVVRGGRIAGIEPSGSRFDEHLGPVALLPGLVNAHTHLDLSGARGRIVPTSPERFPEWLREVIAFRRARTPGEVDADVRAGIAECVRFGTTLVGDISAGGASIPHLAEASLRAVPYFELIGLDAAKVLAAYKPRAGSPVSPHAPYTVHRDAMPTLMRERHATHVAESPGERELLEARRGPFVPFLQSLGVWNADAFAPNWEGFLACDQAGPGLIVHGNYLPEAFPFRPNQTLVYCPRTHAAFGHPPHPFRAFLRRGVRVCLGTDSLASNPSLDVFAEAQLVRALHPDLPGDELLRMITLAPAEALGFGDIAGSFDAGKSADAVAIPLRGDGDAYECLFAAEAGRPRWRMFRGAVDAT